MTLGEKLKYLRERMGLTQTWLSKKLGYNNKVISKWENDKSIPAPFVLFNLAKIYEVSMEQLVDEAYTFDDKNDAAEILDVLQEDGTKTGFTATKEQVHKQGLWHSEVSCWIANRQGKYLLTKRALNKDFKPDKWAIVAGHVRSGENNIVAIERILRHELNLDNSNYSFKSLITNKQKQEGVKFKYFKTDSKSTNQSDKINRRISTSYILFLDIPLESVKFNKDEISEIKFFSVAEIRQLIKNGETVFNKEYDLNLLAEGLDIDLIDVVDENNNLTGKIEEKSDVHNKGLWHREAIIFLFNDKKEILTYRRVQTTKVNPGLVVPFFGGHVLSGESCEDACVRECFEETGYTPNKVEFLQQSKASRKYTSAINSRFTNFYIAKCPNNINEFKFSSFEIDEPKFMKFDDLYVFLKNEPKYQDRFKNENFDELLQKVKTFMENEH